MKKNLLIFTFIFSALGILVVNTAHAQVGSMMGNDTNTTQTQTESGMKIESVETVLQELLSKMNVSTVQQLDLSKISDDEWERLGDAVMEAQHPGVAHETMDRMMGGEGSENLRQIHINMGKSYLGYGNGNYGYGMMGGGMMGYGSNRNFNAPAGMMGFGSMMGYGGNYAIHTALAGVTWIALIIFLVTGSFYFIKKSKQK